VASKKNRIDDCYFSFKKLLRTKLIRIEKSARKNNGGISTEDFNHITQLARIIEICDISKTPLRRNRWPMAVVVVVTLIVVSVLFFGRIRQMEIELEINSTEIGFSMPDESQFTEILPLSGLGISGISSYKIPKRLIQNDENPSLSSGFASSFKISTDEIKNQEDSVTLQPLILPSRNKVWLSKVPSSNQYRLSLNHYNRIIRVSVTGSILFDVPGRLSEELNFQTPIGIELQPGNDMIDFYLLLNTTPIILSRYITVNELLFVRIEEFLDDRITIVRPISTVLSGKLFMESLDGRTLPIRVGEAIQFEDVKGEIQLIQLEGEYLSLNFRGTVNDIKTGFGKSQRSLMPTYLEYLHSRHGLSLLWGTVIYFSGILVAILKWWGIRL